MHGLILISLKNYIVQKCNEETWSSICLKANAKNPVCSSLLSYPDAEVVNICHFASVQFQVTLAQFLEDFGQYLILDLIKLYKSWIQPNWNSLDFLVNVQCVMHAVAKRVTVAQSETPDPPFLTVQRESDKSVTLIYQSPRKLCPLARGLIKGVGQYYGEPLHIDHPTCMLRGDKVCTFHISIPAGVTTHVSNKNDALSFR